MLPSLKTYRDKYSQPVSKKHAEFGHDNVYQLKVKVPDKTKNYALWVVAVDIVGNEEIITVGTKANSMYYPAAITLTS